MAIGWGKRELLKERSVEEAISTDCHVCLGQARNDGKRGWF